MKKVTILFLLTIVSINCHAQEDPSSETIASRIFLPALDVGYQIPNSDLTEGSVIIKTTVEYRFKNNNDFFIRLSYDTYGAKYNLSQINNTTNTIEGTVQFSDVFLAPGYRFGDNKVRYIVSIMPGIKFYEFPSASINGQNIIINQESKSIFTSSLLTAAEYYFDDKSALTISLFHNQVWESVDFWQGGQSAFGISIGFITSLM